MAGFFPPKDCSAPSCFAYTDAAGQGGCCKWNDYSFPEDPRGEWEDAGELRPCTYETGDDKSLVEAFQMGGILICSCVSI
eukprot:SAG22_NODE_16864_length_316_cov_0.686636_1_plen_80_part_00